MQVEQFQTLARYHSTMNQQFFAACETLSEDDLFAERKAFFGSIFGTLNHMLLTDRMWLGAFTGESVSYASLDEQLYDAFEELHAARFETDQAIADWIKDLNEDQLVKSPENGMPYPLWLTLTHFFNHQTHHRGQVSQMLSECGVDYGLTDLPWVPGVFKP